MLRGQGWGGGFYEGVQWVGGCSLYGLAAFVVVLGLWVWRMSGLAVDLLVVTASREGNGGCLIGTFLY